MTISITRFLDENQFLLADGATGTNLFSLGLESGEAPEIWNETEPKKIRTLYKNWVDAGCDLFLTNSFGSNRARLKLHGAQHRAYALSFAAAEIGREIVDQTNRTVILAGSIGPIGEVMEPAGTLTHDDAVEIFHEQVEALMNGGVDIVWLETISCTREFSAAAEAFARAEVDWCGTMSFDTRGRTMMGYTPTEMISMIDAISHKPKAFGANCGNRLSDLVRTIKEFKDAKPCLPIIAKGNAGIPKYIDGHIVYNTELDVMGNYAVLSRDCGARIIGGCCGTTPRHLREMREALDMQPLSPPPNLKKISDVLGSFSSSTDGTINFSSQDQVRRHRRYRQKARRIPVTKTKQGNYCR